MRLLTGSPLQLLFQIQILCLLNRQNYIEQIAVALHSVCCSDFRRLGSDQLLFLQPFYIFAHRITRHLQCVADRSEARMTPECFPVFSLEQICIDSDLSIGKIQTKNFIRQRKIISDCIAFLITVVLQILPPVFSSTHLLNFSFGTMSREPIRSDGNPFSCISS